MPDNETAIVAAARKNLRHASHVYANTAKDGPNYKIASDNLEEAAILFVAAAARVGAR